MRRALPLQPPPRTGGGARLRLALLRIAAIAGMTASALLVADGLRPERGFCPLAEACEKARSSALGTLLGVPTATVGLVAFAALLALTVLPVRLARAVLRPAGLLAALAGATFLVYQATALGSFCPFCVVADLSGIAAGLAVFRWRRPPAALEGESLGARLRWVGAGAVVAAATAVLWPSREPEPGWVPVPEAASVADSLPPLRETAGPVETPAHDPSANAEGGTVVAPPASPTIAPDPADASPSLPATLVEPPPPSADAPAGPDTVAPPPETTPTAAPEASEPPTPATPTKPPPAPVVVEPPPLVEPAPARDPPPVFGFSPHGPPPVERSEPSAPSAPPRPTDDTPLLQRSSETKPAAPPPTPPPAPAATTTAAPPRSPAKAETKVKPPPRAPTPEVALVEYLNPFCPHCRATHARLNALLRGMAIPVRRYRVYVWSTQYPPLWAQACASAAASGKEDALFEELMRGGPESPAAVWSAARRAGLDPGALSAIVRRGEWVARLDGEQRRAAASVLRRLPTIDVGRRRLEGEQSERELRAAIEAAATGASTGSRPPTPTPGFTPHSPRLPSRP